MSFAAFLRFDELVHIRAVDVKLNRDFMSIHIARSKTDQLRKGDEVVVARTNSKLCPVNMMQKYMAQAGIHQEDPSIFQDSVARPTEEFDQASCQKVTNNSGNAGRNCGGCREIKVPG